MRPSLLPTFPPRRWQSLALVVVALGAAMGVGSVSARDFRSIDPIQVASKARRPDVPRPVPTAVVEKAVRDLAQAWSEGRLETQLDADFVNADRLEDVLRFTVPRGARLRVLSVRGINVLDQRVGETANEVVSTVTVTVESQIEFTDAARGLVQLRGGNELSLRVVERF